MTSSLELRTTLSEPIPAEALTRFEFVGLTGLLDQHDYRAHRSRPTGAVVAHGYAWRLADQWTGIWWPQGIAVGQQDGIPLALVSWYAQPRNRGEMGARITVVDLRDARRPRYHHVLLVVPKTVDAGTETKENASVFDTVQVHAGGIAWSGDRLLVAATFHGLLEFRLSDILKTTVSGPLRRGAGPFGYRYVLPMHARHEPVDATASDRMRYSFLALENPAAADSPAELLLLTGEYGHDPGHRIACVTMATNGAIVTKTYVSPVAQMQGVASTGDRWYVSSSHGETHGGDLWSGPIDKLQNHDGVLPPGPQSLAFWPERNELWSVSEVAGRRWLFGIDLTKW
jgi:hypothetical protein